MRLPATALALAAMLAVVGCGDEEPEQIEVGTQRPAPQRPAVDTATGDTVERGAPAGGGERADAAGDRDRSGAAGAGAAGADAAPDAGRPAARSRREAGGQRLYTVQVAAFTSPDSATKWTGRLSSLDLPAWTSMAEHGGETFYRVRVGAVPDLEEARRLGGMLSQRFEWPVWVAPVSPAERVPEDAVAETRRVLGGG